LFVLRPLPLPRAPDASLARGVKRARAQQSSAVSSGRSSAAGRPINHLRAPKTVGDGGGGGGQAAEASQDPELRNYDLHEKNVFYSAKHAPTERR